MEKSPPLRLHESSSALSPISQPACLPAYLHKRSTVVLHRKESDVRYLCLAIQCGNWVRLFHVQIVMYKEFGTMIWFNQCLLRTYLFW